MKRNLLAILIPSLLIASGAHAAEIYNKDGNKLDFYGKVKAEHYFSDSSSNDGDQSYVRFGFKGQTKINDVMTGYGQWEYQVADNVSEAQGTSTGTKTRIGFAGLKFSQYGSFDYGRNYGVLYDVAGWTDMFPEFGGDGYTKADRFMTGRGNGMATYRNRNFFGLIDGLNLALQYQGKNDDSSSRTASTSNGDGYAVSATYDIGAGISAGGAYTSSDRTNTQANSTLGKGDKANAWNAGLKYDNNGVYLAAIYAQTERMVGISVPAGVSSLTNSAVSGYADKTQTFEAVAQYQFDWGLRPSLGYVQTKAKDIEGVGDADLIKYIDLGTTYYFNKNMSTFVDYKINRLNKDNKLGLNNDDVVAVGLVYQF